MFWSKDVKKNGEKITKLIISRKNDVKLVIITIQNKNVDHLALHVVCPLTMILMFDLLA